jgi:23S rRNA pseudouridine2457 synthase
MTDHGCAVQSEGPTAAAVGCKHAEKKFKSDAEEKGSSSSTIAVPAGSQTAQHFKMYKPTRVLTQFTFTRTKRKKRKLLGDLHRFPEDTMAIGRLDEDSEGLLLLTTDGITSNRVRQKSIEKEYYCQVDGIINKEAIGRLRKGVEISVEGKLYTTLPCQARILDCGPNEGSLPPAIPSPSRKIRDARHGPTSWVSITITEGKNRQVRRMTAAVGHSTLRLVRVRVGTIVLDGMAVGEVRKINIDI